MTKSKCQIKPKAQDPKNFLTFGFGILFDI